MQCHVGKESDGKAHLLTFVVHADYSPGVFIRGRKRERAIWENGRWEE